MAGISRSSTIVISYLMRLNNWDDQYACNFVKKCRYQVSPNDGFMSQLNLYSKMNFLLQGDSMYHLIYRVQHSGYLRSQGNNEDIIKLYFNKKEEEKEKENKEINNFECKICNTFLFTSKNIYIHVPINLGIKEIDECPTYFVEHLYWMNQNIVDLDEGNLNCPKCNSIIGKFRWKGVRCFECNSRVKPSFQIEKQNVKKIE